MTPKKIQREYFRSTTGRLIKLTIPLDLLCTVWTSRTNLNQTIDERFEELLIKGLSHAGAKP